MVDVKRVGRDLGDRCVLEGSVRRTGNRIRIAGQLIDADTGAHLWADHFDGALQNLAINGRCLGPLAHASGKGLVRTHRGAGREYERKPAALPVSAERGAGG